MPDLSLRPGPGDLLVKDVTVMAMANKYGITGDFYLRLYILSNFCFSLYIL